MEEDEPEVLGQKDNNDVGEGEEDLPEMDLSGERLVVHLHIRLPKWTGPSNEGWMMPPTRVSCASRVPHHLISCSRVLRERDACRVGSSREVLRDFRIVEEFSSGEVCIGFIRFTTFPASYVRLYSTGDRPVLALERLPEGTDIPFLYHNVRSFTSFVLLSSYRQGE